jgi:SAM-dependent methyltransferase
VAFPPAQLQHEFVDFVERTDRPKFIGTRFRQYFPGRVLDIGCDRAALRGIVGDQQYAGVGLTPDADVKVDLELAKLPFPDGAWDTVMCLDVLEHLDNLHAMFGEIVRVASRYVVITLPNNWSTARKRIAKGHGSFIHYGLPLDRPDDRHKWFFNTQEACEFLVGQAGKYNLSVRELVALEKPKNVANLAWRRLRYPLNRRYLNLYPHTVVCVYDKAGAGRASIPPAEGKSPPTKP